MLDSEQVNCFVVQKLGLTQQHKQTQPPGKLGLHGLTYNMVFESLVADLLNKYLGEYVDNLDRSQLKIGIWGGKLIALVLSTQNLDTSLDNGQTYPDWRG